MARPCYFAAMNDDWILLASCCAFLAIGCSDPSPASGSDEAARNPVQAAESFGVPACWTVPAEQAATAEWKHFAAVDRLDPSFRASVHGQLMHLCWAEDGMCPGDTALFGFFRDILSHFTATVQTAIPWNTAGTASIRMGPVIATESGITVDAAAFIWTEGETVVGRRYALDATDRNWTLLDDQNAREEAVYALAHAGRPFLDMEWAWPETDTAQEAFEDHILPALSRGAFSGGVSREIRVTPLDSTHWGWESVTDYYGCGAPHGWVDHRGSLFNPQLSADPEPGQRPSWTTDWSSPWAQIALDRMRILLHSYYENEGDLDCGGEDDLYWADKLDITEGLRLCARPGPGGTVFPTLFNQGDPPDVNRANGYCTPRLHLDLSQAAFEELTP